MLALVVLIFFAASVRRQPSEAYAVPSYSSQTGMPCSQCHTIWPRLNEYGRQFKVKGYIDQGTKPGFPLSFRFTTSVESSRTSAPTGAPTVGRTTVNVPFDIHGFIGAALGGKFGMYMESTTSKNPNDTGGTQFRTVMEMTKWAYNLSDKEDHPSSLVVFKGDIFTFDPFISLGDMHRPPLFGDDFAFPYILNQPAGLLTPLDTDNYGIVAHGFFGPKGRMYGAAGTETGGKVASPFGDNRITGEPLDFVSRFAYEGPVGEDGTFNIGAAYYKGSQRPDLPLPSGGAFRFTGGVERRFIDAGLQLPVHENDVLEFAALYGNGLDTNLFQINPNINLLTGPFRSDVKGFFFEGDYLLKGKYGFVSLTDHSNLQGLVTDRWGLGFVWFPQEDFKITLQGGPVEDNSPMRQTLYKLFLSKTF